MIEIPLYIILAPTLAVIISFLCGFKRLNIVIGPSIVFFLLSLPVSILPVMNQNIGIEAIFGWAFLFAIITLLLTMVINLSIRSKLGKKKDS